MSEITVSGVARDTLVASTETLAIALYESDTRRSRDFNSPSQPSWLQLDKDKRREYRLAAFRMEMECRVQFPVRGASA